MMDIFAHYNIYNLKGQMLKVGVLEMRECKNELIQKLDSMQHSYGRYETMFYCGGMLKFDWQTNSESLFGYAIRNRDTAHLQSIYDTGHFTKANRVDHFYVDPKGNKIKYQRLKIRESDRTGDGAYVFVPDRTFTNQPIWSLTEWIHEQIVGLQMEQLIPRHSSVSVLEECTGKHVQRIGEEWAVPFGILSDSKCNNINVFWLIAQNSISWITQ